MNAPPAHDVERATGLKHLFRRLANRLSIHPGEGGLVWLLTSSYFLVFGGSIIGRNARDSLFLKNFGVENLPYMYAAGALLVIATSTVYSSLIEKMERRRFVYSAFLFFCALLITARLVLAAQFHWFYPVLYMVCQAVSIVSGMLFWTATEELYDIRQAKRLLPIVTVGGVLSMITCGFVTKPLVHLFGTANLFLVWVGMLVLTVLLLRAATTRYKAAGGAAPPKRAAATGWTETVEQGFREMRSTRLLRAMAGIGLANTVVFMLVDFQFSQVMVEAYPTQDQLTSFLGTFRGLSGFLGLLIQVAGVPWLISNFGVGAAIAVEPVLMLLGSLGTVVSLNYATAYATKFIDNTLFFTVQGSAFQLLFNPLPLDRRPRIRAFIEGSYRPLMNGISALLLAVGIHHLSRRAISVCAVVAGIAWVASSLKVRRGYIEALVENLGGPNAEQRISAADTLAKIRDPEGLARLADAIRTAPAESAVPAILLLERFGRPESQDMLVTLVSHPVAQIRATAVAALGRLGSKALVAHLNRLLQDPDPRTRANAVEACVLADPAVLQGGLLPCLNDPADRVQANAAAVLAQWQEKPAAELLPRLGQMAEAGDPQRRASAAYALAWFPAPLAQPLLLRLLADPEEQPRRRALRSLERLGTSACVPDIIHVVSRHRVLRREARQTLLAIAAREPEETFRAVVAALDSSRDGALRLSTHLLGRMNRVEALPHLTRVLSDEEPAHREEALAAIERLAERHPLPAETRAALESLAVAELGRLDGNLARRTALLTLRADSAQAGEASHWLADEMLAENRWIRGRVFRAAALLFDGARVREIARAVEDPDSRKRANALEALEYVAPGEIGRRLADYVEQEKQEPEESNRPAGEVLGQFMAYRQAAVRAAAVLLAGRARIAESSAQVEQRLHDPDPMVREAAVWSAARLLGDQWLARLASQAPDPDPRVARSTQLVLRQAAARRHAPAGLQGQATAVSTEVSMLMTVEKVLFLKSVPLFSSLEGDAIATLAEIAQEQDVEARQVIFEAGDHGDELYVIVSGRLQVYRGAGQEVKLAELGARECFGEMALLDSESRSASVATLEPCRLLKIHAADFRELLFERPQISLEILRVLARRLRHMDEEVEEHVRADSVQHFM